MKETEALNLEISYFSYGNPDKQLKLLWQTKIKNHFPLLLGVTIFAINKLFSLNNLFLLILSGGILATKLVLDIKNGFRDAFRKNEIDEIEEEQEFVDEDYFTEKYKYDLMFVKQESLELKKYQAALKKQQEEKEPYIKLLRDKKEVDEDILTKEEVMEELTTDLDTYYYAYQLPPFEVKNKHWQVLIDKTYDLFETKGLTKDYYSVIAQINRLVLAETLVEKKENITIENYINNLYYLKFYGIKYKECLLVQKAILEEINKCQIIDIEKVRKKKLEMKKSIY